MGQEPFRISVVPGVTPDKWARIWARRRPDHPLEIVHLDEAEQLTGIRDGSVAMGFVRLPVDTDGLHLIPLYHEVPVVVLAKEHPYADLDRVDLADLGGEHLLQDPAEVPGWAEVADEVRDGTRLTLPPMTVKQAVEVVASGTGIVVLPMSVARMHHRKDVAAIPVDGVPETRIGLAWLRENDSPLVEEFVGVVRGRTEHSSRGVSPAEPKQAKKEKRPEQGRSSAKPARPRRSGSGGRRPRRRP